MIPILLLTDGNLGLEAFTTLRQRSGPIHWYSWRRGDLEGAQKLQARIEGRQWECCLSFYSDFVLSPSALNRIRLPLNLHPALPSLRGVGHDVVPILQGHGSIGTTVHVMEERIDHGPIVAVSEYPLETGHSIPSLRRLNQRYCLRMLQRVAGWIHSSSDIETLECRVREMAAHSSWRWGSTYYSHDRVAAMRQAAGSALQRDGSRAA
jgi:methionyl-tRNA formyltransferase